jgi:tetratricopeptide (TPR) repeat protein
MFLSLLLLILTLQTPQTRDALRWLDYLDDGRSQELREAIQQQPAEANAALETLLADFDSSIHSWRDTPEQRRVQYSQTILGNGLQLSRAVAQVSGDNTLQRRFEARRDRIQATQLLNDGEFQEALSLIESVRSTARQLEDRSFLFSTYLSSAYAHLGQGRPESALADCEIALQLAREIGDRVKHTLALFNLGTAHLHLSHYDQALTHSREAARSAAEIGNLIWEANAWLNVGYVEIMQSRYESAQAALEQTLTLSQKARDPLGEGRALYNLGVLYSKQERWDMARDHLEQSLKFIRGVDIRHSHDIDDYNHVEKDALERLLYSYQQLNLEDPAVIDPLRQRLEEFEDMGRPDPRHAH